MNEALRCHRRNRIRRKSDNVYRWTFKYTYGMRMKQRDGGGWFEGEAGGV